MNILLWILFGGIVGWTSSVILKNRAEQGIFSDIALGVIGSFAGGYIMSFFGQPGVTGFNIYSFIVALMGAVVLVSLGRLIQSRFA